MTSQTRPEEESRVDVGALGGEATSKAYSGWREGTGKSGDWRSLRRPLAVLALLLLQTFAFFVPSSTWNPVSRFGLTSAVAERGTFELGALAEATGDRAHRGDAYYSDKAPFAALLAVPAYGALRLVHRVLGRDAPDFVAVAVGGVEAADLRMNGPFTQLLYVCSVSTAGVSGALMGGLAFLLLVRRFPVRVAAIAAAAVMLGTPVFPYATSLYGHVPAGAFLLGALVLLDDEAVPDALHGWAGACLAAAVGCEYLMALPALVIGGSSLLRGPGRVRRLGFLVLGALGPAVALALYHTVCFGGPLRTGYHFVENPVFVAGHAEGFMGIRPPSPSVLTRLLFGPSRGLCYVAPISAVGLAGLVAYLHRRRDDVTVWAGVLAFASVLLANAGYYMWWGGAAVGPRHLVPVLWVLAVGVAALLQSRLRLLVLVVALYSALQMLAFTAVGMEAPPHRETVFGYAWRGLLDGRVAVLRGASNLGIILGFSPAASLGPLLAIWLFAARALARLRPPDARRDSGPAPEAHA